MTEKEKNRNNLKFDQWPEDNLNARIGVLTRREVEARILAPVIDALSNQFGQDKVLEIVREIIIQIAADFSCARDFALINGFNEKISLRRTQTIMDGADHCDFCYTAKKGN
jgi:hypothetical protein